MKKSHHLFFTKYIYFLSAFIGYVNEMSYVLCNIFIFVCSYYSFWSRIQPWLMISLLFIFPYLEVQTAFSFFTLYFIIPSICKIMINDRMGYLSDADFVLYYTKICRFINFRHSGKNHLNSISRKASRNCLRCCSQMPNLFI